jgi:hypothetical protein
MALPKVDDVVPLALGTEGRFDHSVCELCAAKDGVLYEDKCIGCTSFTPLCGLCLWFPEHGLPADGRNAICWSCCAGKCAKNTATAFLEVNDHNMKTLREAQEDEAFMDRAEKLSRIWDEAEKIVEDEQQRQAFIIKEASRMVDWLKGPKRF